VQREGAPLLAEGERTRFPLRIVGRSLFELAMDLLRVDMCYLEIIPAAREDGPRSPARR